MKLLQNPIPSMRWLATASIVFFAACGGCGEEEDPTPDMSTADVGMEPEDMSGGGDDVAVADMGPPDMMGASCTTVGCEDGQVCDEDTDTCVACLDASQCGGDTPICRNNECIACLTDPECSTAAESNPMAGPTCHSDGRCVGCESDSDCPSSAPFCGADNECFACESYLDCPAASPLCSEGTCVSCADAAGCTDTERLNELLSSLCRSAISLERLFTGTAAALYDAIQASACAIPAYDFDDFYTGLARAVAAGRISLDVAEFERCRQAGTSCSGALVPTVADGGSCWIDSECLSGQCDDGLTCPGTCRDLAAEGEGCATNGDCYTQLTCVSGTCVQLPGVGEACNGLCADNAYCDAGFCVAKGTVGGACNFNFNCEPGLFCDTALGVCANSPGPGEPCLDLPGVRPCEEGVRCLNSVCQTPQPVGSTCTDTAQCAELLRCVDGACVEILLPGASCSESAHCALGLRCLDGRCKPLPDIGEACVASEGCIRGDCTGGTCTGRMVGETCPAGAPYRDYFDVCGDAATCGNDGLGGGICRNESGVGEPCGAPDPDCEAGLACRSNVCRVECGLQAP